MHGKYMCGKYRANVYVQMKIDKRIYFFVRKLTKFKKQEKFRCYLDQ